MSPKFDWVQTNDAVSIEHCCDKIGKLTLNHKPWKESSENIKSMFHICFDSSLQIKRYVERMILIRWFNMGLGRVSFFGSLIHSEQTRKISNLDRKFQMATKFWSTSKMIHILISFKTRLILSIWNYHPNLSMKYELINRNDHCRFSDMYMYVKLNNCAFPS